MKINNRQRQMEHDAYLSMVGQPRRRILVDTREIADEVIGQMVLQLLLYREKTQGKNKIRKLLEKIEEPRFNLVEIIGAVTQDVENAYKADFTYLHGPNIALNEEHLKEIEEHKRKAIVYFLERMRKDFSETYIQKQVDELAISYDIEHLKPKPEPDAETQKTVEELRQEAAATVEKIKTLKQEIIDAKKKLDQLWKKEVELLRGTTQDGRSKIRAMIERGI